MRGRRVTQFHEARAYHRSHRRSSIVRVILHAGQHYDARMSAVFFDEPGIRKPDLSLGVGSGSHAVQTAKVMIGIDEVIDMRRPDVVLVAVAHVEAGLRSFDETMPEGINRLLTDRLSDALYTTEIEAEANLRRSSS